jgi:hypothetical protein
LFGRADVADYTASGNQITQADLPRSGYCQYCGIDGAHVELFQAEGVSTVGGKITFRKRAYYACGRTHFDSAVREEIKAELRDQLGGKNETGVTAVGTEAVDLLSRIRQDLDVEPMDARSEWKVMDRYCWCCGTHGAVFKSTTRCSNCGELQRLYLREDGTGNS